MDIEQHSKTNCGIGFGTDVRQEERCESYSEK